MPDREPVRHTVSVGAVQSRESDVHESMLLAGADAALYEAKQGGRSCMRGELPLQDPLPTL